jgi:hypothetical protein
LNFLERTTEAAALLDTLDEKKYTRFPGDMQVFHAIRACVAMDENRPADAWRFLRFAREEWGAQKAKLPKNLRTDSAYLFFLEAKCELLDGRPERAIKLLDEALSVSTWEPMRERIEALKKEFFHVEGV